MEATLLQALSLFDFFRARALRFTASSGLLRALFINRAWRLACLFTLSYCLYFALALTIPLWVLLMGPLLFGVPHILASLRYVSPMVPSTEHRRRIPDRALMISLGAIYILMAMLRLLTPTLARISFQFAVHSDLLEVIGLIAVTAIIAIWVRRYHQAAIASQLLIFLGSSGVAGLLLWTSLRYPLWTLTALAFGHNAVAFFYWFIRTRTRAERWIVGYALTLFIIAHVLILGGYLDSVIFFSLSYFGESILHGHFALDSAYDTISSLTFSPEMMVRLIVAYALGQSLHYFVWMKAIPDQYHGAEMPTSFRQCYKYLKQDFGKWVLVAACAVIAVYLGATILIDSAAARSTYLLGASFHGYLEIAGLSFWIFRQV
jgi:hypothetical protein